MQEAGNPPEADKASERTADAARREARSRNRGKPRPPNGSAGPALTKRSHSRERQAERSPYKAEEDGTTGGHFDYAQCRLRPPHKGRREATRPRPEKDSG
jgi:hypothetical protein